MTDRLPRQGSFRRDVASAYAASASRIGSWVVVSALVYRYLGPAQFGILALVRGTIGILNYVTLGLSPALVRYGAAPQIVQQTKLPREGPTLDYARPEARDLALASLYVNAMAIAFWSFVVGLAVVIVYALGFDRFYSVPPALSRETPLLVLFLGIGALMRLVGDVPGAVLQVRGRISTDNLLIAAGELAWAALVAGLMPRPWGHNLALVAAAYLLSGALPLVGRNLLARPHARAAGPSSQRLRWTVAKLLLSYGGLIALAQLADYLYAPTDYILIGRLLSPIDLASYAPAVQIDAGLLLLVTGLSAVLLPKTALAHAQGSAQLVRRYYVGGTLASLTMLAVSASIIWVISPWLFKLWLGNPMPATQAILPLVLFNTVLGGSSAVGRSILLAVGRAKPFTIAALLSGAANVACSFAFARYLHLGLRGIVLGTVVAVVGRCVLWMPWYVLRVLREVDRIKPIDAGVLRVVE